MSNLDGFMAESEGFEPPIPSQVRRFSRPMPSTTRPALRYIQNTTLGKTKPPRLLGPFCRNLGFVVRGWVAASALACFRGLFFRIGPGIVRRIHRP
jgi:hypothetical protein